MTVAGALPSCRSAVAHTFSGSSASGALRNASTNDCVSSATATASPLFSSASRAFSRRRMPSRITRSGTRPCSTQLTAVAVLSAMSALLFRRADVPVLETDTPTLNDQIHFVY